MEFYWESRMFFINFSFISLLLYSMCLLVRKIWKLEVSRDFLYLEESGNFIGA